MSQPTRGDVKALYLQIVDDPGMSVFTDSPNLKTGALSIFQAGFSQAFDLLFSNALNQQVPRVEQVTSEILLGPSPIPFGVTPDDMGLHNFADWEWIAERAAGSSDKFLDLVDLDRLPQRTPTDRLLVVVYQNGEFNFVGCTSVREMQIKWVSSGIAPTDDKAVIPFDNSKNFLANYAAGVTAGAKGYDEIGRRSLSFAVGPKFDTGSIGGELFRLMQPLVRSRQNVQVAHKPYTTQRRLLVGRALPYVAAQQGTTGGGAQNVPQQYSTANGTITPLPDGNTATFWIIVAQIAFTLYKNGDRLTENIDFTRVNNQFTLIAAPYPEPGDILSAEGYPAP